MEYLFGVVCIVAVVDMKIIKTTRGEKTKRTWLTQREFQSVAKYVVE